MDAFTAKQTDNTELRSHPWTSMVTDQANVYIDFLYTYPVIFRRVYASFGDVIPTSTVPYVSYNAAQRKELRMQSVNTISLAIFNILHHADMERDDVFSKAGNWIKLHAKPLSQLYDVTIHFLFKLYMKRYSNFGGDINEYFIK
ncbi:MAG: hypothetical protein HRU22_06725 [Gammaproteobacteria bacterium]|nr:hypothetical protein [Gammaproteobacteria bacterium]